MTMVVLVVEQLRRTVPGGIGRYATGLLQGLDEMAEAGEAVPEITLHASRPPTHPDPLAQYGRKLRCSRLPGPILTRAWDRGLIRAPQGADLVHAISMAAPAPRRAPLVVAVHDTAWRHVPDSFPPRGRRWHEASFGRVRHRASRLVVSAESVACELAAAGVDMATVAVIPLGADHLPEPDHRSAGTLLDAVGVEGEFLLSVGTLEPRKNIARLIDAYRLARPRLPAPWPLVIVGPRGWGHDRSSPSPALGRSPEGGSTNGVVVTGEVDDGTLAALYERARLLAYVPLTEGFGLPPVEAMRQGTPVLSSDLPSVDGATLVVDPERVDDIASGLVEVATDEGLRSELVARGRERGRVLTWKATAQAHVALWDSAMADPRP